MVVKITNKFINFYFKSHSGYGTSIDRDRVYDYCFILGRTISPMIDIWKLNDSIHKFVKKHRNDSNDELYKSLTNLIINNYKKQNRGIIDKTLNNIIRDYVTSDFHYMYRILYECGVLYGDYKY